MFLHKPNDEGPTGNIREEAFKKLCKFLDDNDECQYSVHELSEHMDTFLDGHEGYSIKHLKVELSTQDAS